MSSSEFEKKVQDQFDELSFEPSDEVWDRVEAQLPEKKKRRWALLFFPLLLAGVLFLVYNNFNTTVDSTKSSNSTPLITTQSNEQTTLKATKSESLQKKETNKNSTTVITAGNKSNVTVSTPNNGNSVNISAFTNRNNVTSASVTATKVNRSTHKSSRKPSLQNTDDQLTPKTNVIAINGARINANIKASTAEEELATDVQQAKVAVPENIVDTSFQNKDTVAIADRIELKNSDIKAVNDTAAILKETVKGKLTPTSKRWTFGVTAGAGFSNMRSGLFNNERAYADVLGPGLPSSIPSSPVSSSATPNQASAGFTFSGGVFLENKVSNRITFHTGLSYVYQSNNIKVGTKIDSAGNFMTNSGVTLAGSYYRNGNTNNYKNNFHLITLPLLLQLKPVHRFPLFAEAGFTTSLLVNSNALQYNANRNAYFKNENAFNRLLFGMQAGVGAELKKLKLGYRWNYSLGSAYKEASQYPVSSTIYLQLPLKKF